MRLADQLAREIAECSDALHLDRLGDSVARMLPEGDATTPGKHIRQETLREYRWLCELWAKRRRELMG